MCEQWGWSVFFGALSILIIVCFVLPASFGLQNFSQWSGMYDDHWCHVDLYSGNPHVITGSALKVMTVNAGEVNTRRVYSSPTHNQASCLMWAKTRCGRKTSEGWRSLWVDPSIKGRHFIAPHSACEVRMDTRLPWFI